jgi:hypothetical protein
MYSGLQLVTPPTMEPVSVADAKKHSRIFMDIDDNLVAGYISVARQRAESVMNRACLPQTWTLYLQTFPGRNQVTGYREFGINDYTKFNYFKLPRPPFISATQPPALLSVQSFVYYDTTNTQYVMTPGYGNTVGNYFVDIGHDLARIALPFAGIWPTTVLLPQSPIQVTYQAGYPIFTGVVNVQTTGEVDWVSGSKFDPSMTGSWVTIGGQSYNFLYVESPTEAQLAGNFPASELTNAAYTANGVPMQIRQAILFLAAHLYENREPVLVGRGLVAVEVPNTFDDLLADWRIHDLLDIPMV